MENEGHRARTKRMPELAVDEQLEAVNVAPQNFSSPRPGGRKPADESRADEHRERLLKWSYFPASARPSLRVLAKALQTSHQLLSHLLVGLEEWEREKESAHFRTIAKEKGISLTAEDERNLVRQSRRFRQKSARDHVKYGPALAKVTKRLQESGKLQELGLPPIRSKAPMAEWTDTPEERSVWRVIWPT
jgi:hypothetical protein